jgi:hypothetical protein
MYAVVTRRQEATMLPTISAQNQTQPSTNDRDAALFAQAVTQQKTNPDMPQPTVNVTGGAATTGSIDSRSAGVNVTVPVDANGTRLNVTAGRTTNQGTNAAGQPVSNTVDSATTTVSGNVGGMTGSASITVDSNRNEITGATTQGGAARLVLGDTVPLDARTNLTVTGSIGMSGTTPQGGATSLVAQPRMSVGVTHKASAQLTVGAQVNVGGNIPLNDAGAAGVAAAGNGLVVTGGVNANLQVAPNVRLTGSVTHGFEGADAPSTNPSAGAFSPGAGQTVIQGGVQVTLP